MTTDAPQNLPEVLALMAGKEYAKWRFSDKDQGLDLSPKIENRLFSLGNYSLKDDKDIAKAMEISGQAILDFAKEKGFKITDLAEFKNADFDKDGKISAKEVGAVMLAASFSPRGSALVNRTGSMFDDVLSQEDMAALLNPKTAEGIKAIASKLLQDNGVKVADPRTGDQVARILTDTGVTPSMRC